MKTFEVRWIAERQSLTSMEVTAFDSTAAEDQVTAMYGSLPGFRVHYITDITGYKKEVYEEMYRPSEHNSSSSSFDTVGEFVGTCIAFVAMFIILYGLFTMPGGIFFIILGVILGWVGLQVALKIDGY